jgi:hypothetical protein
VIVTIHADDSSTPAGPGMTAGTGSHAQDRRRAEMLDRCAGDAYRAGEHSQALRLLALARTADPSMAPQLDEHRALASAARRAAEPSGQPLAEVLARRLAEAGITPDDPVLRRIAEHNAQAQARAGTGPTAAASASEPERERFRRQVLGAAAQMEAGS